MLRSHINCVSSIADYAGEKENSLAILGADSCFPLVHWMESILDRLEEE